MPEIMLNGPAGRLEGRYTHSSLSAPHAALILHPHPQFGGTMNNKVVYSIFKSFSDDGFSTLRFNFRGVGRSQGSYDDGVGELTDAACAMDWLQLQNPNAKSFWVAGFSFGSWIALQLLMRRPEVQGFIAVSPPANKYDFTFLSPCPSPGLFVQGDQDSIVTEQSVAELADRLSKQRGSEIEYHVVPGADHFFREKITDFSSIVGEYVKSRIAINKPKKVKLDRRRRQQLDT